MNTLVSLKEASELLSVPISTLITWNEYHILKPTITQNGEVGYTKEQIDHFLTIQQSFRGSQILPQGNSPEHTPTQASSTDLPPTLPQTAKDALNIIETKTEPLLTKAKISLSAHEQKASYMRMFVPYIGIATSLVLLFLVGLRLSTSLEKKLDELKQAEGRGIAAETQTSNLRFAQSLTSPLMQEDQTSRNKNLATSDTSIFRDEKAKYLFSKQASREGQLAYGKNAIATASAARFARLPSNDAVLAASQTGATSFSSVSTISDPQPDSEIDVNGNISGESEKSSAIATILGGVEGVTNNPPQFNTDQKTQVILLSIFSVGVWFTLKKPRRHVPISHVHQPSSATEKVFEIDQKMDGTIVVNFKDKEYKVSKPELYSDSDRFIERLLELSQPDMKELEYDSGTDDKASLTTPLSRLVTRLGFVGIKRDLFFPRTSKNRVLFRRYVTEEDIASMNLTLSDITADLTVQPALS